MMMNEHDSDKFLDRSKPVEGEETLEEAAGFLNGMLFSENVGAFLEGERVAVCADPHPQEAGRFVVTVSCLACGLENVSWEGLPVSLRHRDDSGDMRLGFLNSRGQARFSGLERGVYSLTSSAEYVRVEVAAEAPTEETRPVRAMRGAEEQERETTSHKVGEGLVYLTKVREKTGKSVLCFETDHEPFAGARIRFCYVDASGDVVCSGEVELTRIRRSESPQQELPKQCTSRRAVRWRGVWTGQLELPKSYELVLQIMRPR